MGGREQLARGGHKPTDHLMWNRTYQSWETSRKWIFSLPRWGGRAFLAGSKARSEAILADCRARLEEDTRKMCRQRG